MLSISTRENIPSSQHPVGKVLLSPLSQSGQTEAQTFQENPPVHSAFKLERQDLGLSPMAQRLPLLKCAATVSQASRGHKGNAAVTCLRGEAAAQC